MEFDFYQPLADFTSVDRLGKIICGNFLTLNTHRNLINCHFFNPTQHSRYEHPYKMELDLYQPPATFISPEPSPAFPPPLEATPFTYVDTEALIDELVTHLDTVVELAIDVEHHSYRTYQGECQC